MTQPTDDNFEGQHFDRKEAGRSQGRGLISKSGLEKVKEHVIKTVSAFSNSNVEGGLLVLGISSIGEVIGIDHLNEEQRNSITNLDTLLRNHATEVTFHDCVDANGVEKKICLMYSAYVPNAMCETSEANPRSWIRNGSQSILTNQPIKDQIRLRKGILDADCLPCCPFSIDDLDSEVVKDFRWVFHNDSTQNYTDERLLYEAGAIVKCNGEKFLKLPGIFDIRIQVQLV